MNHQDEKPIENRFFNKEVAALLLRYILRYRLYLFLAILFVLMITASTLSVPYLSRIAIDRAIMKQGTMVIDNGQDSTLSALTQKKAIRLLNDTLFLYQSSLSRLSAREIANYTDKGFFSDQKYLLIESPTLTDALKEKLLQGIDTGIVLEFPNSRYLLQESSKSFFTVSETVLLRSADFKKISLIIMLMAGLFILQFIASYMQLISLMKLSQHAMRDLRIDLFSHLLSLELSFFDRNPVGKLVNRITNDIESLNEMFSSVLVTFVQDILIMSGIMVIMFATDFRLALIVATTFPLLALAMFIFRAKARAAYRVIRTRIADLNAFLNENISNVRIIQIFTQEKRQLRKFQSINNDVYRANIRQLNVYAVFRPLIDFFRWFAVGSIIYFGAHYLIQDRISYGLIVMFLVYIGSFFEPIGDLAEKFDILQSATAAGEKILSVFKASAKQELPINSGLSSVPKLPAAAFRGEIHFDNVWFSYVPGEWVLKGVSFSAPPRSTLAIVGETGSGKSTIINLLGGYYPIQKGSICIDGTDITAIPLHILRSGIAIVMQDVFMFSRTVKRNITLGAQFDQEKFEQISRITHANHFLSRLPDGADQQVMERGVTFSAGERQLLAFTRALYFDPSILILDEATSNIDTETERLIQDAIRHIIKGRTSILIAHRLSTIRHADQILVLDKGSIIEQGNHSSLLSKRGYYYELHRLQFDKG